MEFDGGLRDEGEDEWGDFESSIPPGIIFSSEIDDLESEWAVPEASSEFDEPVETECVSHVVAEATDEEQVCVEPTDGASVPQQSEWMSAAHVDVGGAVEMPDAIMATALATTSIKLKTEDKLENAKVVTDHGSSSAEALDGELAAGLGPSDTMMPVFGVEGEHKR